MNRNTITIGAVLLIVGIGLGYTVWGNSSTTPAGNHMMSDGSMPARQSLGDGGMGQDIDQHFIVQMIPHHEGAITMAKIALERSKRQEVISLANGIIEAQQKEINDMRSWYQSWFGSAPPEGGMGMMRPSDERGSTEASRPNVHMGGMTGEPATLKSVSAADFDREFLQQMIPHHEMAVMMAQMLAAGTDRPEMKQLASNIIASQSSEIEMMRGWLRTWYGR